MLTICAEGMILDPLTLVGWIQSLQCHTYVEVCKCKAAEFPSLLSTLMLPFGDYQFFKTEEGPLDFT